MEQKDKELLLKDLCARLPYGVIVRVERFNYHDLLHPKVLLPEDIKLSINNIHHLDFGWKSCKPYLRPMSNMTDDDWNIFDSLETEPMQTELFDWLNEHHFDYRGLIPMGLAIEASKDMYKTE